MHLSTYCVAQTHNQTAQQQVQPQTTLRQTTPACQPQQQQRLQQPPDGQAGSTNQPPSTEKSPLQPLGGLNEPPHTPSFCLSMSMASERGRSWGNCLQSCKLGHGMSLLCKRHTMLPRQRLPNGLERGQALPPHGMAHHFGLLAHQPAAAWPYCSRLVPFCQRSQLLPQTPAADLLLLKAP